MNDRPTPQWMQEPPRTLEGKISLLIEKKHLLKKQNRVGEFLRALYHETKEVQARAEEAAKKKQPLAAFMPSYEQALVLNAWMYGIAFICIYAANRIGKTTAEVVNFILWIFPNDPSWKVFKSYLVGDPKDDPLNAHLPTAGLKVQVFPRPSIQNFKKIQEAIKRRPLDIPAPDPHKPHYDPKNKLFLQWLQKEVPQAFKQAYPLPPWDKGGTIWVGGPDHDHFKQIIMPLWREYLPEDSIERDVETNREFSIKVPIKIPAPKSAPPNTPPITRYTMWEWIGKSFESKDTKWSSGAVDAILITEGVLPPVWKEIKARFKDPGIGGHDFTPYEASNTGAATALAQKIKKGTEPVPLPHYVFTEFSAHTAPRHIMSQDKYKGLVESYRNDPEGAARLDGKFYSSSGLVLSNFDRTIHLLDWTVEELFMRYPEARLYRGIDPGLDHPTACAWGALLPTNQWIIYRLMAERGLSIQARCEKIVSLSHNRIGKHRYGPGPRDFYNVETHPFPNSEIFVASPIDYHIFKQDETTGQSYSLNYILSGLTVVPSIHTGPEERAQLLDSMLQPSPWVPSITTHRPPGSKVYFLKNEPGVLEAALKWEEFYWDRKRSGEDKGAPKDKVPLHGDDELDAVCYLTCSPYKWTSHRPPAIIRDDTETDRELVEQSQHLQSLQNRSSQIPPSVRNGKSLQRLQRKPPQVVFFGSPIIEEEEQNSNY